jgi:exopolysaccharide production protein ExoQ
VANDRPQGISRPVVKGDRVVLNKRALIEDLVIIVLLFICFGSIVGLTIKVQQLKEAPSWAILMYMPPIGLAALMCALEPHKALRTALVGGPLLLLVLWALASFQWSNQPGLTMRQGILFVATYMCACVLSWRLDWIRLARVLTGLFGAQAVFSAALALGKPEWGVMTQIYPGAWSGLWGFKQSLGVAMAMAAGVLVGTSLLIKDAWKICLPLLVIALVCVVKSQATTAIIVTVLAIGAPIALWLARSHPSIALLMGWLVVTAVIATVLALTVLAPVIFQALGKAPTLTGRTDIWQALVPAIEARSTLGWGFQAFWTDTSLASPVEEIVRAMDGFRPPDAHSTPTDLHLQLGIPGLVLGGLVFFRLWIQIFQAAAKEPGMMVAIGFFVAYSATCFTESLSLYPMDALTLILQIMVVKVALTIWDARDEKMGRAKLV